ncbi:MAG: NAD(P)-dependent alcohol dehydrogenase [Kordiimonadaceae bacterium]|nr:NAD(P)-dependent alcohol dehydrogenase [Kordiimonadaceae bacterium]
MVPQYIRAATLKPGASKLSLVSVSMPVPGSGEILVEVRASVVNEIDVHTRRGSYQSFRPLWSKHGAAMTGFEFAGIAQNDGKTVRKGDRIAGVVHILESARCHAQYICVQEKYAGIIPDLISFEDAVSTLGMSAAAIDIFENIAVPSSGQKVLVIGASGGLGIYSVQYAKYKGAEVTAVCSRQNATWVQEMGADHIRPYDTQESLQKGDEFDLIIDCPYKYSFSHVESFLANQGMYVNSMPSSDPSGFQQAQRSSKRAGELLLYEGSKSLVETILRHVTEKNIVPAIDSVFKLEDIDKAFDKFEKSGKQGRILLSVA